MLKTDQKFGAILADPPWTFLTRSNKGKGRSPEKHYGCMTVDDIRHLPVAQLAAKDCALFMWVTDPMLPTGLEVMAAWGFEFKTIGFNWAKLNKSATEEWTEKSFFTGMGYWSRANPELCLLGTRGSPKRLHKDVRRLLISRRR